MKHLMSWRPVLVLLAVLALAACAAPTAVPQEPAAAPQSTVAPTDTPVPTPTPAPLAPAEVVTTMAGLLTAGDLEGGMAYWADEAIWYALGMPPNGFEMIRGKEALRIEFENEIAAHLTWEVEPVSVVDNVVTSHDKTWLDFTRQIGVAPVDATGQYLVEDGKIVEYTWTPTEDSASRLKAALAEVMPELMQTEPEAAGPDVTPVSELTVTIADGTCSIEEPVVLKAGRVYVTVDVKDQDKEAYAVIFETIDPRKDFVDVMASTAGLPPIWALVLHYEVAGPGESVTYSFNAAGKPLYAICWARPPDHPIGNLGPFEVVPATSESSTAQPTEATGPTSPCQSLGNEIDHSGLPAKEALSEMVARLNDGDVEGAMAYFAEDASSYIFGVPPVGFEYSVGREAICASLAEDVRNNLEWELTIQTGFNSPSGSIVTAISRIWLDQYRELEVAPLEFFTTFKVKDGKIIDTARWLQRETLARLRPVMSEVVPPAESLASDTPGSEVTMVFSDDVCFYDGPSVWKSGDMSFSLETMHQAEDQNGYVTVTLEEGYDYFDLAAATRSDRPSWVRYSNIFEFGQWKGEPVSHAVSESSRYYLMCFSDNNTLGPIGLYGPFEVVQ